MSLRRVERRRTPPSPSPPSIHTRSDLIACSRSSADLLATVNQDKISLPRSQAFYTVNFLFFAIILLVHLRPCSVTVLHLVTRNGRVYFCCPCFVAMRLLYLRTMVALLRSLFVASVSAGSGRTARAETAWRTAPLLIGWRARFWLPHVCPNDS
jgi:hypothetical protein